MRVQEGKFAYDIDPIRDQATMLFKHFKITVTRSDIQGSEKLFEGTAKTFDEAQAIAEQKLKSFLTQANAA